MTIKVGNDVEGHVWLLLMMLQVATGLLLLLVIVDRPYRDSEGHDGMTGADALQILSLVTQLANYRLAVWCLARERTAGLSDNEELLVALVALLLAIAPLVPAIAAAHYRHRKDQEGKKLVVERATTIRMHNPIATDTDSA